MPPLSLSPLSTLRISSHLIPSHSLIPNSTPHSRPLIIYHAAYPPSTAPSALESHLPSNALTPQWRYTMYPTSHFHSTTHEVLCVYAGRARLLFGGDANPKRVEVEVGAGDALVVPAGVAHRLVEDVEGGFRMVGAYPEGCSWDMCYGKEGEGDVVGKVRGVKWFERDPLYGEDGPVLWGREELEGRGGGMEG